jgi:hypothetical protein
MRTAIPHLARTVWLANIPVGALAQRSAGVEKASVLMLVVDHAEKIPMEN